MTLSDDLDTSKFCL